MSDDDTQPTQPKKGEPVAIPVPKRSDVFDFFRSISGKRPAQPQPQPSSDDSAKQ